MAEAMPHGRIEVLPSAGHLPWIDYPDQVADLVRTHVTSAEAAPPPAVVAQ